MSPERKGSVIEMRHPREELISALVDGKLGVAETRRIAAHLHDCARCRDLLADFERNKSLFRAMEKPEMPDKAFWNDTFRKMRTTADPAPAPSIWDGWHANQRQAQAAFAALACIVAAIVVPISARMGSIPSHGLSPIRTSTAPVAEDCLDAADVSTFVRAHTESAAYQPLGDPDRQQMIAAEADGMHPDAVEAVTDADVSP